ncbi:hypothetical protein BDQ17DRAFT_1374991 [Cyathus striatus]|nr:hypothetical protein BDQ17DRAFT_1374991 [Cyathus striatus]
MSTPADAPPPPPYIQTLYDETHRSKYYQEPRIMSMAHRPNLIGYLEHHAPTTDGSFSICVASGEGVFISERLYNSIPDPHRPALDTTHAGQAVPTLMGNGMTSIGNTFLPLLLTNAETGEKFRRCCMSLC